ncbi:MAG: NINE protein [Acetobacteraceae bacterium]
MSGQVLNSLQSSLSADALAMMQFQSRKKSAGVAYLLWLFLGGLGLHRFYLRRYASGSALILILLLSLLLLFIPILNLIAAVGFFVLLVWWVIDAALIPGMVRTHNMGLIGQLAVPAPAPQRASAA